MTRVAPRSDRSPIRRHSTIRDGAGLGHQPFGSPRSHERFKLVVVGPLPRSAPAETSGLPFGPQDGRCIVGTGVNKVNKHRRTKIQISQSRSGNVETTRGAVFGPGHGARKGGIERVERPSSYLRVRHSPDHLKTGKPPTTEPAPLARPKTSPTHYMRHGSEVCVGRREKEGTP